MTTPIRRQYLDIKRRYPHAIVLFRLGDFYETFDDDAELCARELDITLTSRPMGKNLRVPLAGIPYHALEGYLAKLIAKGYKVAICEQTGDASGSKGLMPREVVRVVTPGTVLEGNLLDERTNNYLAALAPPARRRPKGENPWTDGEAPVGLAYVDVSTGEFVAMEAPANEALAELERLAVAEVVIPEGIPAPTTRAHVSTFDPYWFGLDVADEGLRRQFGVASLEAFGLRERPLATRAAGAVLAYLREHHLASLSHIRNLTVGRPDGAMALDPVVLRHLEVFEAGRDRRRDGSLLATLDFTETPMGSRLLRRRLARPLLDIAAIDRRLDEIQALLDYGLVRARARELLRRMPDLERLVSRVSAGMANPRDLVALRRGLETVPDLREALEDVPALAARELARRLRPCEDAVAAIAQAISDDPPASLDAGDVVRPGFSQELDSLRLITRDVRRFLAELEAGERQRTGIKSLRVGYNKVFGYYIEVSKANAGLVPEDYERRQTLVNAERYVTPQLRDYESQLLTARERIGELETAIFRQVCAQIAAQAEAILATAAAVAELDVAAALAEAASRYGYCRPVVDDSDVIIIRDGRHPTVERALGDGVFVPNDTELSSDGAQIVVITGPNMAGKSTYLRQVALITLMAQCGCFVPAREARIGLVDRIFTRVGAQDDLASGQSTFMVEMLETANILRNATPRSLVVLDEIGRGTSTYDGLAIARAVVEYLHNTPEARARTLFATHYHELVALADALPRVRNATVAVTEENGKVVFLHRIVPGAADRSYGVHVAELAGLPRAVVRRAREVLVALERNGAGAPRRRPAPLEELPLFAPPAASPLIEELASLDPDSMTPLEALTKLYELRRKAKGAQPS
ncbi:MAG TPA: DNA mismatch repair protein MutS [Dehalococcoidia bacterium]|nr:DNA mismatch repair protein MutS [Dehalococcoidia bacterium]